MKLTSLETRLIRVNHRGDWLHVILHTDEGISGIGEASHGGSFPQRDELVKQILHLQIEPVLMGCDLRQLTETVRKLKAMVDGLAIATAVSACEQALWDLAGKAAGTAVAQLMGNGNPGPIPLYANINRSGTDRTPAGFAAKAANAVAEGYSAIKLAPFDGIVQQEIRDPVQQRRVRLGIDCVAAVSDAVGPSVDVMVDCHSSFDMATGEAVARELAACGVTWFEEPLPLVDIPAHVSLKRSVNGLGMELVGGELLFNLNGFYPWIAAGAFDVIMPDVKHCGGIAALRAIGELANSRGIAIAPHNPSGPVATIASAQALAGVAWYRPLEIAWGEVPWRSSVTSPGEHVESGNLRLPAGVGLGISLTATDGSKEHSCS